MPLRPNNLRAERHGEVGVQTRAAGPERGPAALVERVRIRVGAVAFEV